MNDYRDIQHPDITQAEKAGYPWFPRKITVEASQEAAKAYCADRFGDFFDCLVKAHPYAVINFLDDNQDDFAEFVFCADF